MDAKHHRLSVLVALAGLLLSGCASIFPDKTTEQTPLIGKIPPAWQGPHATQSPPSAAELASWWEKFNDPILNQLVVSVLNNSPDIKTARATLQQARATRDLQQANFFPSLDVSAAKSRSKNGKSDSVGSYSAGFDTSWELDFAKGDNLNAAEADQQTSAASLAASHVSLSAETALQYVSLRSYQQRLKIANDNIKSQAETLQLTEWKQQAGLLSMLNVEQARTNLQQSKASVPSLTSGLAAAEHRLAILSGEPPTALSALLQKVRELPTPPKNIAVGIPLDTLRQRPDVRAAEFSLLAEIARSRAAQAARYPSLNFSGSFGWQAASIAALGGAEALARSLVASIAANLFDGGRISAKVDQQDAVRQRALYAYESTILTALEDVENALTAYTAGHERVDSRRRAAVAARNAAQLAHVQYQSGTIDFQQVLDTDRTLLHAEDSLASAESDLLNAVITLYKALGGGWSAATTNSSPDAPSPHTPAM